MSLGLINDSRLTTMYRALSGLASRQQAITSNIANIDTPNYQRQDVSFEQALVSRGGTTRLAATAPGHMTLASRGGSLLQAAGFAAEQGQTTSTRNDGNNVDMDYEMTKLAETSLRYQLMTQTTSQRFATLREVVRGTA